MTDARPLAELARALEERALSEHRARVAETEARRREIAEIDALRDAARDAQRDLTTGRLVGADMIWQGWLLRRRSEAMREAALARAAELDSAAIARLALARKDAAEALVAASDTARKAAVDRHRQEALEALMVLAAGQSGRR